MSTVAVIVNYRTADDTLTAIRSLQASLAPLQSIIVVDNGSGDDSVHRIAANAAGIRLIDQPINVGFAGGCNLGIREALSLGADAVFLLNPDATVSPTTLSVLGDLLNREPQIGIVGPIIVSKEQPGQVESCGIRYSQVTGRMWNIGFNQSLVSVAVFGARRVDAVSGCAMLIRQAVFQRIGLLDEDFFFGFEDIDFCLRARDAGFESAIAGSAAVAHRGQSSIGRGLEKRTYFATRNHLLLAERREGPKLLPGRLMRIATILSLNFLYAVTSKDQVAHRNGFRGFLKGARDYFAHCYGPGSLVSDRDEIHR